MSELSILEAVIRQTGVYAKGREGRVSVFWGDQVTRPASSGSNSQVFIPSKTWPTSSGCHADILVPLGAMPSAEEWRDRGLDKYGLIAVKVRAKK